MTLLTGLVRGAHAVRPAAAPGREVFPVTPAALLAWRRRLAASATAALSTVYKILRAAGRGPRAAGRGHRSGAAPLRPG